MPTRENNTMAEGLSKILKDISQMKVEPDADMAFLVTMETNILDYLKPPVPGPGSPGGGPGAPPPGMGGGPPMGPGGALGGAMQQLTGPPPMATGMPGMAMSTGPGAGMPNPDEFRRTLGQTAMRQSSRGLIKRLGAAMPFPPGL